MHTTIVITLAMVAALSSVAAPPSRQIVATLPKAVAAQTTNLNDAFWLYRPKSYDTNAAKFPLIIYLHGSSRRGTDIEQVKANGIPPLLDKDDDFPFVVASPQSLSKHRWQECWRPDDIYLLLQHLLKTYHVDPDRVYLTGLSMGGYGTWAVAAKHSASFAAIIPICGGGDPKLAPRYNQLPIWAFHGEEDYVVPIKRSQEMVDAIKKAGGNVTLTSYPNTGHDSFTRTYANPKVFEWLKKHRRKPGKNQ